MSTTTQPKRGRKPKEGAGLYVVPLKDGRLKASARFAFDKRVELGTLPSPEACQAAFDHYLATGERILGKRGRKPGTKDGKPRVTTRRAEQPVSSAPVDRIAMMKRAWARTR